MVFGETDKQEVDWIFSKCLTTMVIRFCNFCSFDPKNYPDIVPVSDGYVR